MQRKHCKLLYTHSKEEITAIIKNLNRRLEEESSDEESSNSENEKFSTKRISELGKEAEKPKISRDFSPPNLKVKSPPPSSSKPRLSAPNVPPGTSINVSSFSLVSFGGFQFTLSLAYFCPFRDEF